NLGKFLLWIRSVCIHTNKARENLHFGTGLTQTSLSLAKTKMWEVKSKITDSYDKMKLFEKKRDGEAVKKQIQNMEYNERIDYLK
ncbi:hypothetical protein, partial [Leptospira interrogans]|uniref:hypothetical protein n=1 Tax=Leptospira interrogans TaxID=173 RepID=UPI000ABFD300